MRCVPNIGEPPSYFGGSHVIEHQSPPTSGTKGASGASGMSADETIWPWPTIKKKKNSQLSTTVLWRLTDNLDLDTGRVFASLILQDYLVVAAVLPLCDFNRQAGLVAVRFSSDTMARLKDHLCQTNTYSVSASLPEPLAFIGGED